MSSNTLELTYAETNSMIKLRHAKMTAYHRQWRLDHPQYKLRHKETSHARWIRIKNDPIKLEQSRQKQREWARMNAERKKKRADEWAQKNPDKIRAYKQRALNKMHSNPEKMEKKRQYAAEYRRKKQIELLQEEEEEEQEEEQTEESD
jgi:hypothetical protein